MSPEIQTAEGNRRGVALVIAGMFGVGVGFGAVIPLLSLRLAAAGVEPWVIGLNAAMGPLAALALGPLLPRILHRLGLLRSIWLGMAASLLFLLPMPFVPALPWWPVLRFAGGLGIAIEWVAVEVWLNLATSSANRGLVMSVYATTIVGGAAVGPLMLNATGTSGALPFLAIAAALGASMLPVLFAGGTEPAREAPARHNVLLVLRAAPIILVAALAGGGADLSILGHLPVYLVARDLGEHDAVQVISVFVLGNALLQIGIGWLSDRIGRVVTLLFCSLGGILGAVLLPWSLAAGAAMLWPLVFLWGACVFGVYTAGVSLVGDRFGDPGTGAAAGGVAAANTAFVVYYEIGSSAGPVAAGFAMTRWPGFGLLASVALIFGALAFACLVSLRRNQV